MVIGAVALAAYHYPELDLGEVRAVCARYRLPGLDELIADAV